MLMYKIIGMCIECATVLRANNMRIACEYKVGEHVPCYSRLMMSGFSLEGKVLLRSHKTQNSKALISSTSDLVAK